MMDKKIEQCLEQVCAELSAQASVQHYKAIKQKVQMNARLQKQQAQLAQTQKEYAHAQYFQKKQAEQQALMQTKQALAMWQEEPWVQEYNEAVAEANALVQEVCHYLKEQLKEEKWQEN